MEGLIAVQNKCESGQQKAMKRKSFVVRVKDGNRKSIYMCVCNSGRLYRGLI